ncbi:MAG: dephospho-CoA kinase [Bacteriovoracaceae bacterium]|nr:dephospho-CoA kinase [Bacteriovoracaceae bacterium]
MKKIKSNLIKLKTAERLYQLDVPIIGLTGGIATGKSTAAQYFKLKKLPLIDADQIVKNIYHSELGLEFVLRNFPDCIENKKINFPKLRSIVFNNVENKNKVEGFIFSHFENTFKTELNKLGEVDFIIYDVPLLFEKKLQSKIDINILVACDDKTQIKRLIERDKIEAALAQKIIQSQMPIADKLNFAQFIIKNDQDLNHLHSEIDKVLNDILEN